PATPSSAASSSKETDNQIFYNDKSQIPFRFANNGATGIVAARALGVAPRGNPSQPAGDAMY
uniref:Uncharacterized protein n=1 Tax=Aegilops tauschii subsp. strangulata TaxID=200361 RepID=A0A453FU87_AEGTS